MLEKKNCSIANDYFFFLMIMNAITVTNLQIG